MCWDPNVDLHHKTYKRLGEERLTDLLPLCRLHHDLAHDLEQEGRQTGAEASSVSLWSVAPILRERHYRRDGVRVAARQTAGKDRASCRA